MLSVRTGQEEKVCLLLGKALCGEPCRPFIPTKVAVLRNHGSFTEKEVKLYAGYVFLEVQGDICEFARRLFQIIKKMDMVYRLLHYGSDKYDIGMRDAERLPLLKMFGNNFRLEKSKGFLVDDKVHIVSGPLVGFGGLITKIYKHDRKAMIEFDMMGTSVKMTVSLELIERI